MKPSPAHRGSCALTTQCPCCHLVGPGVNLGSGSTQCLDLTNADLRNLDLNKMDFENADLTCASFDGTNLVDSVFVDAIATAASFVGVRAPPPRAPTLVPAR